MSYKIRKYSKKGLRVNESYEGETLEIKIQRLVKNKEPLEGSVPLTYTERKEGVRADTNIRTDRFEIAAEAMDKVTKSNYAKRAERVKAQEGKDNDDKGGLKAV